jgi:phosphoadenosine phosphosulfate reductase
MTTGRGVPDGMTASAWMARLAAEAGKDLADAPARDVIEWAAETFGNRVCVTSSMNDAVVVHLAASVKPGIDVIFLDTGYHFPETIGTRDAVRAGYRVNLINVTPARTVAEQDAELGPRLHGRNPDLCCYLRKIVPLERALGPYDAWITGIRREETSARSDTQVVAWDARRGVVKVNPLASWTQEQIEAYIADNDVLVNPLVNDGYASIGCAPCTMRTEPGADPRSGRWPGLDKTECGLHQ